MYTDNEIIQRARVGTDSPYNDGAYHHQYHGTQFADDVEARVAEAGQAVANWWERRSADQVGIYDDAFRLATGGAKNVANYWKGARTVDNPWNPLELAEAAAARTIEGGLKVLDAGSYYGGIAGGNIARMVGWDPRIGGAIGNVGGDLLLGGAIAKAPKYATKGFRAVSKTDTMIGRLAADQRYKNIMRQVSEIRANPSIPLAGEYTYFEPKLASPLKQELIDGVPTYVLKKRNDQNLLRETIWNTLEADSGLRAGILDLSIDRNNIFGNIGSPSGDGAFAPRRIQGLTQMIKAIDEGGDKKTAFKGLTFGFKSTSEKGNLERALRMKPPSDGSVEKVFRELWPDDPAMAAKMEKAWRKQQMVGFNKTREAARRNGITLKQFSDELATGKLTPKTERFLEQFDAGHWRATMSEPHFLMDDGPGWSGETKIWDAPTSSHSARIESRVANQLAKADITHDINPFAAKMIGVPRTWEEDILMWIDRTLNTGKYPDWFELGSKYMTWAEDIAWDMPQKQVEKAFEIFEDAVRKDPTHFSNQKVKDIIREVNEAKDLPSFWATLDDAIDTVTGTEKGAEKFFYSSHVQEMAEQLRSMGLGNYKTDKY